MFRYLLKYVGKYRVLTELTTDTNDFVRDDKGEIHPDYDELYIPCNRDGKIKHTYQEKTLAYFNNKKPILKRLKKELDDLKINYEVDEIGEDYIVLFNDKDLNKFAKLVGARTAGKKISPFSEKNIPDRIIKETKPIYPTASISYSIPKEDKILYYNILGIIKDKKTKNEFKKKALADFIKTLKDDEFDTKRAAMQMKEQEYIHYIGQWQNYLNYMKEHIGK